MAEQAQTDSAASENYLGHVFEVMRENERFLRENAQDVYGEIVDLANDAIEYLGIILEHPEREEESVRRSMFYFLNHVLMPLGGAIWLDVLSGNLPVCFAEIRSILESLVKCYLADLQYPHQEFFQERLRLLEEEKFEVGGKQQKISISMRMKELGKHLGLERDFIALWGRLSERWVHTRGVMNQLVDQVVNKSDVPAWALVVPMNFGENDLGTLDELREHLARLRNLLKVVMEKYSQQLKSHKTKPASSENGAVNAA